MKSDASFFLGTSRGYSQFWCSFFVFTTFFGCTAKEKIGENRAVQVALNDPAVLNHIDNPLYVVSDVSVTHLSIVSASPLNYIR